jgi:hypothetical protein
MIVCGMPAMSDPAGALRGVITDGETGFLVSSVTTRLTRSDRSARGDTVAGASIARTVSPTRGVVWTGNPEILRPRAEFERGSGP